MTSTSERYMDTPGKDRFHLSKILTSSRLIFISDDVMARRFLPVMFFYSCCAWLCTYDRILASSFMQVSLGMSTNLSLVNWCYPISSRAFAGKTSEFRHSSSNSIWVPEDGMLDLPKIVVCMSEFHRIRFRLISSSWCSLQVIIAPLLWCSLTIAKYWVEIGGIDLFHESNQYYAQVLPTIDLLLSRCRSHSCIFVGVYLGNLSYLCIYGHALP